MWTVNRAEGTAVGLSVPVAVGDNLLAMLTALWDDETGARVSVDWQATDDLSDGASRALADTSGGGPARTAVGARNASIATLADWWTGLGA